MITERAEPKIKELESALTSMRPRSDDHGKTGLNYIEASAGVTSMRPRSDDHGKIHVKNPPGTESENFNEAAIR